MVVGVWVFLPLDEELMVSFLFVIQRPGANDIKLSNHRKQPQPSGANPMTYHTNIPKQINYKILILRRNTFLFLGQTHWCIVLCHRSRLTLIVVVVVVLTK